MRLHLQTIPDDPKPAGYLCTARWCLPVNSGRRNLDPKRIYSEDKILHDGFPAIAVPKLVGDRNGLEKWIQPVSLKDKPLTFRTVGAGHPEDVTLSPFYRLFNQRYCVYSRFPAAVNV